MPWVLRGLRNGVLTTRYPRRADAYEQEFAGAVGVSDAPSVPELTALCPSGAIGQTDLGRVSVDRGRCVLCGRCVAARPDVFSWVVGAETARLARGALVVPPLAEDDRAIEEVRGQLAERVRAFGRSVHIRHLDAGSDGAEEWEVAALVNPVYDVHRLGIFFTASPRHADVLLVTGAGAHGMIEPLTRTLEAMARPVVVIAAGTDAISGGLVSPSYATSGGICTLLPVGVPVDVYVSGSPPSPFSLLHAILLALGKMPDGRGPAAKQP